jgi:hypothetical protein
LYCAEDDPKSPFYGREYSEFEFTNQVYNYLLHPQWDDFGSSTLYMKLLYVDYDEFKFAVIELIGEWNDALYNDVMILKRDIADELTHHGVKHFIFIGENVLNFHYSDESYYEEWFEELEDGWVAFINFQSHVLAEMKRTRIDWYIHWGGYLNEAPWRTYKPHHFFKAVNEEIRKRIGV